MKRGPHHKEKKSLSAPGLLNTVRGVFLGISIPFSKEQDLEKRGKKQNITLADCLMSALAMFSLKSPSLLLFDRNRKDRIIMHNLKTLYGIENVPSDTYMRERLDDVQPANLRDCYLSIFHEAQRGKVLEHYEFLNTHLCLVDGSGIFSSQKVHCKNCCEKHHRDGSVTYHHEILGAVIAHPDRRQVIPICPEPITKQDGAVKNDCERNAFHRLLKDLKREHPRLKLTIVSDALSATTPHINELKSLGYDFIINIKPEGNKSLFEWVKGITKQIKWISGKNEYLFRYVNDVPLNQTENTPQVNFIECEAIEIEGRKVVKRHFSW